MDVRVSAFDCQNPLRRRFLISHSAGRRRLVPIAEVRLLQAEHKYVTAWLPGVEALLDDSLCAIEREFSDIFLRVHRNALVAVRHIDAIVRHVDGGCTVELADVGVRPRISRRQLPAVRRRLASL